MQSDQESSIDSDELDGEEPVVLVVIESAGVKIASTTDPDFAFTVWAAVSEDPKSWDEIAACWPRYCSPAVPEFADAIEFASIGLDSVAETIGGSDDWLVVDLLQKRVLTGQAVQPLGYKATLAMVSEPNGQQQWPVPFRLPPWWELVEQTDTSAIKSPRQTEIRIPKSDRAFLFGEPMIADLTDRQLRLVAEGQFPTNVTDQYEREKTLYELTVMVHRDWLMAPRSELGGACPRTLLHGAHDWSDSVVRGQRLRFEDVGIIHAIPTEMAQANDQPMGREEMVIYFDLCREILEAGWYRIEQTLKTQESSDFDTATANSLRSLAREVRDRWIDESFEGGSPPRFIIECSRRRVPRGAGVAIGGMDEQETEQHVADCDCPICDMMASGLFGVGFTSLDGHHLELDDEFAFSLHEHRDEWEQEQREFREMSDSTDAKMAERQAKIDAGEIVEDEFASAWSSPMTDESLPGDPAGHLKLAFLLAEIVGDLQSRDPSKPLAGQLNSSFRVYRESDLSDRTDARADLDRQLERVLETDPDLVGKVVDFQSRLDELDRDRAATGWDGGSTNEGFPF